MKLYTEEAVRKAIDMARDMHIEGKAYMERDEYDYSKDEVVNSLTPIELPSDEEIQVIALNMISNLKDKLESREEAFYLGGFQTCINWIKEQILNQNK